MALAASVSLWIAEHHNHKAGFALAKRDLDEQAVDKPQSQAGVERKLESLSPPTPSAAKAPTASAAVQNNRPLALADNSPLAKERETDLGRAESALSEARSRSLLAGTPRSLDGPTPLAAARPGMTDGLSARPNEEKGKLELSYQSRQLRTKSATPPTTDGSLQESDKKGASVSLAEKQLAARSTIQRFSQTAQSRELDTGDKAGAGKLVLASFDVVQVGNELRIVDADGSVYAGHVRSALEKTPPTVATTQPPARNALTAPAPKDLYDISKPPQPGAQAYFFEVAGTNRTLNEEVFFSGRLTGGPESVHAVATTNRLALETINPAQKKGGAPGTTLPLPDLQISGKAIVGHKQELQIDARPTQR